jgi:hypothetical protein
MGTNTVTNLFGNLVLHPSLIIEAEAVDDIVTTIRDTVQCPSFARAIVSNHSTAPGGIADSRALIRVKMNPVLDIGHDSVTVQTDVTNVVIAKALEAKDLQVLREKCERLPVRHCHITEPYAAPAETTSSRPLFAASRIARRRLTISARLALEAMLESQPKDDGNFLLPICVRNHYNCLHCLGNGAWPPGVAHLQSMETPSSAS